ncbi:hypothetical protein B0T20DRAFT_75443 [Sordaria brevicollis]|uniref:Secreted protein n=1 Tax=Sordaria brevicollis TaxID=83679 RepID=A0AAE0P2K5_SORBR|nr:hypothetical protein B0T20DRAFT_75443 [Sordaria brevicollis]
MGQIRKAVHIFSIFLLWFGFHCLRGTTTTGSFLMHTYIIGVYGKGRRCITTYNEKRADHKVAPQTTLAFSRFQNFTVRLTLGVEQGAYCHLYLITCIESTCVWTTKKAVWFSICLTVCHSREEEGSITKQERKLKS